MPRPLAPRCNQLGRANADRRVPRTPPPAMICKSRIEAPQLAAERLGSDALSHADRRQIEHDHPPHAEPQ